MSSHFQCSTCIEVLYFTLHFNGLFSILYYTTVITHRPMVRYGSSFIAFPWSWVFLSSQHSVISGGLRWAFTRTYSSHQFCPSLRWTSRFWLAGSWGRLIGSTFWLAQLCSSLEKTWTAGWPLEGSRACCDKWAFSSLSHHHVHIHMHAHRHTYIYTHKSTNREHTLLPSSPANTASLQNSWNSAACRLGFQIYVNL